MSDADTRHALVFALAHEIGNHLAGIRLEAHLLDEELDARGLARASVAIDSLAGRAGPLLALLRPLLAPGAPRAVGSRLAAVLESVRRQLEEEGVGGRPVELEIAPEAAADGPAFEGLHDLLLALVGEPGSLPPGRSPIVFRLGRQGHESELVCELPGEVFAEIGAGQGAAPALRGRVLAVAIARVLVADAGGRVELPSESGRSRIVLRLPRG
jgi:hypothetical protein